MGADVESVDVLVVGAGLAGLSCALEAARLDLNVLVVERGDEPGAKNVTGGRIYLEPLRDLLPEGFWDGAPLERRVTHESLCLVGPEASTTVDFTSDALRSTPASSATVLRARLDRWLSGKVEEAGAFVVPQAVATSLIRDEGKVVGVMAGDEELRANMVVAADGVLSFVAREAGLAPPIRPEGHALGIKQVVALDEEKVTDRFGLEPGEGAARLYLGEITRGLVGGGFLYTNEDSLSIGLVLSLEDLGGRPPDADGSHAIMDAFLERPEVRGLVRGGEIVEYSAHLVPELGIDDLPTRVGDGLILAGDAAGFVINHGVTVRGMDLAMASGILAARACKHAAEQKDTSASTLAEYDRLLADSFVLGDLERHREAPDFLRRERLHRLYPRAVCDILEDVFRVGPGGKERLWPPAWKKLRESFVNMQGLKDMMAARKL